MSNIGLDDLPQGISVNPTHNPRGVSVLIFLMSHQICWLSKFYVITTHWRNFYLCCLGLHSDESSFDYELHGTACNDRLMFHGIHLVLLHSPKFHLVSYGWKFYLPTEVNKTVCGFTLIYLSSLISHSIPSHSLRSSHRLAMLCLISVTTYNTCCSLYWECFYFSSAASKLIELQISAQGHASLRNLP